MTRLMAVAILLCSLPSNISAQQAVTQAKVSGPIPTAANNYAFLSANRVQAVVDLQKGDTSKRNTSSAARPMFTNGPRMAA